MIKNPERNPEEASAVPDWRAKLPKNTVVAWQTYEGPEVPTNPAEREELRTKMLNELWELKEMLQVLPRHQHFTLEQLQEGFNAECINQWLPLIRRLDSIAHHWRHLYPGIDIVHVPIYDSVTSFINDLLMPEKLSLEIFNFNLSHIASQFRTYDMCYFRMIDDPIIQQKLTKMIRCLTTAANHYDQDWQDALDRKNRPTQFAPPT